MRKALPYIGEANQIADKDADWITHRESSRHCMLDQLEMASSSLVQE